MNTKVYRLPGGENKVPRRHYPKGIPISQDLQANPGFTVFPKSLFSRFPVYSFPSYRFLISPGPWFPKFS